MSPQGVSKLYQSTKIPVQFTATMAFSGRTLSASLNPQLGFQIYISDQNDISPTGGFGGGSPLRVDDSNKLVLKDATKTALASDFQNGDTYSIEATTEVEIESSLCRTSSLYMCVKYVMTNGATMIPQFRELNPNNDFSCVDISSNVACHDSK